MYSGHIDERLAALRQLDAQARAIEGRVAGPSFDEFISKVALGIVAFLALVVVFYLMVAKPG